MICCIHQAYSLHVLVQAIVTYPQAEYHSLFSPVEAVNVYIQSMTGSLKT